MKYFYANGIRTAGLLWYNLTRMKTFNKLVFAAAFTLTAGVALAVHPSEVKYPTPNPPEPCKPKNILGIGNSFMYSLTVGENNLVRLAKKLGYNINHTALFKENCSMSMHWENRDTVGYYSNVSMAGGDATPRTQPAGVNESNASLESLLAYGTWDVVVLQSGVDKVWSSSEWKAYSNLVAHVHATNPNAKIFLHQTWGMGRNFCKRDGLPSIDGRDDFYESVAKEYSRAYHEPPAGVTIDGILPIGYATELYYYREPSITISQERFIIHPDDDKHLSHSGGEAMQAMVWCKILFGDVPSVANMPATFTSSCGDKLGLLRECALAACEPDVSYFDYGRGTVDFRFNVTFKNYDGTVLDTQSISNLTSAVAPDISLINVGEGYEPSGWKSSLSAKLMTSEEVNKAKVYNPITYTLNRKLVGEAGPTRVWTGYTSKSWNVAGNWDPAVVPDKDSDVYIPLGGAGANMLVQLDEAVTVNSLTIGTGEGEGTAELSLTGNNKILTVKGDLVIKNKGKLSSESNGYYSSQNRKMRSYTGGYKVDAVVGGNITIDEGGSVDVSGKGYVHGRGFKSAYTSSGTYDSGEISGSHAGNSSGAGTSTTATPSTTGKTYGSIRRPTTVGGGGHQYNFNGFGGGAIHLVCTNGTMTINGDILACGESYTSNGSYPQTGAGGSIWLEAGSFFGTGTIDVRGGAQPNSTKRYGCGASGRVALYTRETSFHAFNPSAIRVFAGPREAYTTGTANQNKNCHGGGTIYREHCNHTPGRGDLIIDGGDVATINEKFGTVISQYVDEGHDEDAIFNMISIQNQGRLIVNDGQKLRTRLLDIAEIGEKGSYSGTIEIVGGSDTPDEPVTPPVTPTDPDEPDTPVTPPDEPTTSSLPDNYVSLEYVTIPSGSYISTGLKWQANLAIDTTFIWRSFNNTYGGVFGAGSTDRAFAYASYTSGSGTWKGGSKEFGISEKAVTDVKYHVVESFDGKNFTISLNEGAAKTTAGSSDAAKTTGGACYLGQYTTGGKRKTDLYYAKIYTGLTTLERDYVPAYNLSTKKYGVYDLQNGEFSVSGSSTALTGPAPQVRLTIAGFPDEVEGVSPAYGEASYDYSKTTSVECTAPESVGDEESSFSCTGWELTDANGAVVRTSETPASGESALKAIVALDKVGQTLTWKWAQVQVQSGPKEWNGGAGSWQNPDAWTPAGVPSVLNEVVIPPGSSIVISNAINIASLDVQGSEAAPSTLTFAAKDAVHRVSGSVTLGANTVMTHADNFKYIENSSQSNYYRCNPLQAVSDRDFETMVPEQWYSLNLEVGGDMTIAEGAKVDVSGAGFGPGLAYGQKNVSIIASHAGVAPQNVVINTSTDRNKLPTAPTTDYTYGSIRHPTIVGGGGKRTGSLGDSRVNYERYYERLRGGGGAVHLAVAGALTVNGDILAMTACRDDYSLLLNGRGAGGSIWLETTRLTGSGTIDVRPNCKLANNIAQNGSAGRIAIYQTVAEDLASFTGAINAGLPYEDNSKYNGNNYNNAAPGTIYIENANDIVGRGELIVDAGGHTAFNLTNWVGTANADACRKINCALVNAASLDGDSAFRKITVKGRGILTVAKNVALTAYEVDTDDAGLVTANLEDYGTINTVAAPTEGTLVVTGEPQEYVIDALPEYFAVPQTKAVDSITHFDAPTDALELSPGVRTRIAGYRIDRKRDGVNWSVGTNCLNHTSIDYRQINSADTRLVWLWANEVEVTVSSSVPNGKLSFDGVNWSAGSISGWFRVNTPVTIYGGENEELSYQWAGLEDRAKYDGRRFRVVTFTAAAPRAITVSERPVAVVTVTGDPDETYLIDGLPDYSRFFCEDGETRNFAAPEGLVMRNDAETVRAKVIGYRLDGGPLVEALSYKHTQVGLADHTLAWCWTNEMKIVVHNSSEFADERFSRIGSDGDWAGDVVGWAQPGATVTLFGGQDEARFYSWTGLPADATFDDDAHRRVATFKMPSSPLMAIDVHLVPQPGVFVEAEPRDYQVMGEPAYGVSVVADGAERDYSATERSLVVASGVRVVVAGYRLETWDETNRRWIPGETHLGELSYHHRQSGTGREHLIWLWTNEVKCVVRSVTEGGKVSVNDGPWCEATNAWLRVDQVHTVKGSENSANSHWWTGEPAGTTWNDDVTRWIATIQPTDPCEISVSFKSANLKDWAGGAGSWGDPSMWRPVGVPDATHDVTIPAGSEIVISNALNVASLDVHGSKAAPSTLTFAAKDAVHHVSGSVTLGANTTVTHAKNWHWYSTSINSHRSIAVNVKDSSNATTFRDVYSKTPPAIWYRLDLEVGGDMTIAAGAKIDVTDAGYGPGWSPAGHNTTAPSAGNPPVHAGSASCGYKFVSGTSPEQKAYARPSGLPIYGSVRRPVTPGSGANYSHSAVKPSTSAGGGMVHLTVAGELAIDGEILSRSSTPTIPSDGNGSGGSVWLSASHVTGAGVVDVRGGDLPDSKGKYSPNASSGRIAIYQTVATENPSSLALRAGTAENQGDNVYLNGANGTIYLENAGDTAGCGELIVDYGGFTCFNLTNDTAVSGVTLACQTNNCALITAESLDGNSVFRQITVRNGGILTVEKGVQLETDYLVDTGCGMITATTSGKLPTESVAYSAAGFGSIAIKCDPLPPPVPPEPPAPPQEEEDATPTVNPPAARAAVSLELTREGATPVYSVSLSEIAGKTYDANTVSNRWFAYDATNTIAKAIASGSVDYLGRGEALPDGGFGRMCFVETFDGAGFVVRSEPVFVTRLPVVYLACDPAKLDYGSTTYDEPSYHKENHTARIRIVGNGVYDGLDETELESIHCRGNITCREQYSKMAYKLKFGKKANLFGMGKQKHWVLLANYFDPTLMGNVVVSDLFRAAGGCAMDSVWVEVFVNGNYRGVYQFCEQIRVDKNRVNVHDWEDDAKAVAETIAGTNDGSLYDALEASLCENLDWLTSRQFVSGGITYKLDDYPALPKSYDVSGGYLVEMDGYGPEDEDTPLAFDSYGKFLNLGNGYHTFASAPKNLVTNRAMTDALAAELSDFQAAIQSADSCANGRHYSEICDLDSMVAFWIIQSFSCNQDSSVGSRYLYKDCGGKFVWGPAWDFSENAMLGSFGTERWTKSAVDGEETVVNAAVGSVNLENDPLSAFGNGLSESDQIASAQKTNFLPFFVDDPYFCLRLWERWQDLKPFFDYMVAEGGRLDEYAAYLAGSGDVNNRLFAPDKGTGTGKNNSAWLYEKGKYSPMPFSGKLGLANCLKRYFIERRAVWDRMLKDVPSFMAWVDSIQQTAFYQANHPAPLVASPEIALTVNSPHVERTVDAQPGMTDIVVERGECVKCSAYLGAEGVVSAVVSVNGISNGSFRVEHHAVDFELPATAFTNPQGRRNLVQITGYDAAGARLGCGYALVEAVESGEPGEEGPHPSPADAFMLSGAYAEPILLYSDTNATVTLAGMTAAQSISLAPTDPSKHPVFTIRYLPDTTNRIDIVDFNVPAIDAGDCDLVITGEGVGKFTLEKKVAGSGAIRCRNLTVLGGETVVKFDKDKDETACVFLTGDYLQRGGSFRVSMPQSMNLKKDLVTTEQITNQFAGVLLDTKNTSFTLEGGIFEAKVGGRKSAGVKLKKSCVANLTGGSLVGEICGEDARIISGGTINFAGVDSMVTLDPTTEEKGVVMSNVTTHARVFKADRAVSVTGGAVRIAVDSAQSEGLGADEEIAISGGMVEIVAGDDAIQCEANVVISGGKVYVKSVSGDGIDANGDLAISGGLVLAYALSGEEKGLDVNNAGVTAPDAPAGTLTISGGKVVALGGPSSRAQGDFVGIQPTYRGYGLDPSAYSEKFLVLAGTNEQGVAETTAVKLPEITGSAFSLLASVPAINPSAAPAAQSEPPAEGALGFHDVYVYTTSENPPGPPEPPTEPDEPVVPQEPDEPVAPADPMNAEDGYEFAVDKDWVLVFTNTTKTMTFTVPKGVSKFDYLVVGGGGGGGRYHRCGGGGAGGLVSNTVSCVKGATYTIKVGAGGQKAAKSTSSKVGEDGKDSSICIGSTTIAVGYGGGGGGSSGTGKINGRPGGSGGGSSGHAGGLSTAAAERPASEATQPQAPCGGLGNSGGVITSSKDDRGGSGGGGAGGAAPQVSGSKGGAGGVGVMSMITGEEKWYAAGGGGGGQSTGGAGGSGIGGAGGGSGSSGKNGSGSDGLPGTGSGGGGSGNTGSYQGGSGGHGVVIIRYTPLIKKPGFSLFIR